jgi:LysM repeat protein
VPNTPPKKPTVPNYEQSKNPKPEIKRPAPVMPTITGTPAAAGFYIVSEGDTLFSIAKKHNLSVQQLKALNNLDSDSISLGQSVKVK